MPKFPTFPDCLDECNQITITSLKRLGYLRPDMTVSRPCRWTRSGEPFGSIGVIGNLRERFVQLDYRVNGGEAISYRVRLESIPKHFGGCEWYFICPATGKRCRTLYGIGKYFYSRHAYPSAMYSSQTASENVREMEKVYRSLDLREDYLEKRHSRTIYKGKLTKRFARLLDKEGGFDRNAIMQFLECQKTQ